MLGSNTFTEVFGSIPSGDDERLIKTVVFAIRSGFAIVLDKPGTKIPMCTLTASQAKAADREAQTTARNMGDANWHRRRHGCGLNHALTLDSVAGGDPAKVATKVGAVVRRAIKLYQGQFPNIGVHLGLSNMIVIDVDTDAEHEAFKADAAKHGAAPVMTVKSPGVFDINADEWKHKDGGHFWYFVPEGTELPTGTMDYKAKSGWVAMWGNHQVLVPPSSRKEGAYEACANPVELPGWLAGEVISAATARMERATKRGVLPDGSDDIDVWSTTVAWDDLLTPDGWIATGLPDRCSCPVYTAPGTHASPKSATAHDLGCDQYDSSPGHAPLHVWTDNPPEWLAEAIRRTGTKTFSKIQYLAWRDHDGATRPVLVELGLSNTKDAEFGGFTGTSQTLPYEMPEPPAGLLDNFGTAPQTGPAVDAVPEAADGPQSDQNDSGSPFSPAGAARGTREVPGGADDEDDGEPEPETSGDEPEPEPELTPVEAMLKKLLSSADLDRIEEPEPLVAGMLDLDTLVRVTGKSNAGKSFFTNDLACCIATGQHWHGHRVTQGLVVYVVAEGARGWKKRVRAWESRYLNGANIPRENMLILPEPVQAASEEWHHLRTVLVALNKQFGLKMVVFDTQARITVGVNENDNTEMGIFVQRLEQIRRDTHACVMVVHHLGHNGDHGRGATAVLGALETEIRVDKPEEGHMVVENEKQKNESQFAPIKFKLDSELNSVVPVPDGWIAVDPDGDPMLAPEQPKPEPTLEERFPTNEDKIIGILYTYFSAVGATRAELRTKCSIDVNGKPATEYGRVAKTTVDRLWNAMVKDRRIVPWRSPGGRTSSKSYVASPAETARLGLT
jgi:hypothetical protein